MGTAPARPPASEAFGVMPPIPPVSNVFGYLHSTVGLQPVQEVLWSRLGMSSEQVPTRRQRDESMTASSERDEELRTLFQLAAAAYAMLDGNT